MGVCYSPNPVRMAGGLHHRISLPGALPWYLTLDVTTIWWSSRIRAEEALRMVVLRLVDSTWSAWYSWCLLPPRGIPHYSPGIPCVLVAVLRTRAAPQYVLSSSSPTLYYSCCCPPPVVPWM